MAAKANSANPARKSVAGSGTELVMPLTVMVPEFTVKATAAPAASLRSVHEDGLPHVAASVTVIGPGPAPGTTLKIIWPNPRVAPPAIFVPLPLLERSDACTVWPLGGGVDANGKELMTSKESPLKRYVSAVDSFAPVTVSYTHLTLPTNREV